MCDRVWLILIALAAAAPEGPAQAAPRTGERIRIFASSGTAEGTLVALDTAAVRFVPRAGGEERTVPLATVARMEVQRGRRSAVGRGAGIGMGIGAALGAALALATASTECEPGVDPGCLDAGTQALAGAGFGGLVGAALGAIIGAGLGQDAWVPARLRDGRLAVSPERGGIRVALSAPF